jgi:hypothetical protein
MRQQIQQLFFEKLAKASSWLVAGGIAGGALSNQSLPKGQNIVF